MNSTIFLAFLNLIKNFVNFDNSSKNTDKITDKNLTNSNTEINSELVNDADISDKNILDVFYEVVKESNEFEVADVNLIQSDLTYINKNCIFIELEFIKIGNVIYPSIDFNQLLSSCRIKYEMDPFDVLNDVYNTLFIYNDELYRKEDIYLCNLEDKSYWTEWDINTDAEYELINNILTEIE